MWGICLDYSIMQGRLGQAVIQYNIIDNNKAAVTLPKAGFELDIKEIRELTAPPKYSYGEQVFPCNHPEMTGIVVRIGWHFKRGCCFYHIRLNGKIKSKRYFAEDLKPVL